MGFWIGTWNWYFIKRSYFFISHLLKYSFSCNKSTIFFRQICQLFSRCFLMNKSKSLWIERKSWNTHWLFPLWKNLNVSLYEARLIMETMPRALYNNHRCFLCWVHLSTDGILYMSLWKRKKIQILNVR